MDKELDTERQFDQECIDALVRLGMREVEAVLFLGRFLTFKTGQPWALIQVGDGTAKFFVPTEILEGADGLKN